MHGGFIAGENRGSRERRSEKRRRAKRDVRYLNGLKFNSDSNELTAKLKETRSALFSNCGKPRWQNRDLESRREEEREGRREFLFVDLSNFVGSELNCTMVTGVS